MKCSLGISNFLEETSIVFLYFFALITKEGFLISPWYSLELCIQMGISFLSPLLFASLIFTAICKASSDRQFAFAHFFFFNSEDHNKLWQILKIMGIPGRLTCLLSYLYAGQEATVRTGHGKTDWFQIGKGVCQVWILSPCLFNLYAEYIMTNAWLDEAQVEIMVPERNINNLRYADNTTLMAESKKELLMKKEPLDERWKSWLKTTFQTPRSWHPVPSLHGK